MEHLPQGGHFFLLRNPESLTDSLPRATAPLGHSRDRKFRQAGSLFPFTDQNETEES